MFIVSLINPEMFLFNYIQGLVASQHGVLVASTLHYGGFLLSD